MEKEEQSRERRSQIDYGMAFKLQVIAEVEKGELTYKQAQKKYGIQDRSTVLVWIRKHGNLDWKELPVLTQKKTPEQRIKELEELSWRKRRRKSIFSIQRLILLMKCCILISEKSILPNS